MKSYCFVFGNHISVAVSAPGIVFILNLLHDNLLINFDVF